MQKTSSFRSSLSNILFWSVISAAFIGPGTVTTAASAGASYQLSLLWGLLFSTLACLLLQEAAARIKLVTGMSLGEAIAQRYGGASVVRIFIAGAIIFGGMAYQAGNIMGAVAGFRLIADVPPAIPAIILSVFAAVFLFIGKNQLIAKILGAVVAFMGIAFVLTASLQDFSALSIMGNAVLPRFPAGSELLLLGLVGTTIVPYNLFLGSGIEHGQSIGQMRLGLGVAILLGGIISAAVLITGAGIAGDFSFEAMAISMQLKAGRAFASLFAFGLFAAGFSSALTAPLAAAITAQSMFGRKEAWESRGWKYRIVWGVIILCGLLFGASGIRPVPMIILAQALNGFLLPWLSIYVLIVLNDKLLMGPQRASMFNNILLLVVIFVTVNLGLLGIVRTINSLAEMIVVNDRNLLMIGGLSFLIVSGLAYKIIYSRKTESRYK